MIKIPTNLLCLACGGEFKVPEDEHVSCCPGCGDVGIPADLDERPEFKITWHELRCLVMWAERWASSSDDSKRMQRIVYGIADRLHMQHMDGPSLTFAQELAGLRSDPQFGEVSQNVIREDYNDEPKPS